VGILRKVGNVFGHIINIRADKWFDIETRKKSAQDTYKYSKAVFTVDKPVQEETFAEAMQRLQLTEKDITNLAASYQRNMIIFSIMAVGIFLYSLYLVIAGNITGFCLSLAITVYACLQLFRNHFWLFQIKKRKLGCTLKEWLNE